MSLSLCLLFLRASLLLCRCDAVDDYITLVLVVGFARWEVP